MRIYLKNINFIFQQRVRQRNENFFYEIGSWKWNIKILKEKLRQQKIFTWNQDICRHRDRDKNRV